MTSPPQPVVAEMSLGSCFSPGFSPADEKGPPPLKEAAGRCSVSGVRLGGSGDMAQALRRLPLRARSTRPSRPTAPRPMLATEDGSGTATGEVNWRMPGAPLDSAYLTS